MNQQTTLQPLSFNGRTFSIQDLRLIQEICSDFSLLGRTELARTICELLDWKRPNGGLKNHEGRLLLERMQQLHWVNLPDLRPTGRRGPHKTEITSSSEPEAELVGSVGEYEPLSLELISKEGYQARRLWREYVERYHYLHDRVPVGAQLRYLVRSPSQSGRVLACLLWTSPAWKMAVRDGLIGWNDQQRRCNLQRIVNNARFLILPWVHVRGLASKILSLCARQVPGDWEIHYGYRPWLLESLVDSRRFRGTCYLAANWIALGSTQGRGRMDRHHVAQGRNPKQVFVYPLCRNVQQRLRNTTAPELCASRQDQDGSWA